MSACDAGPFCGGRLADACRKAQDIAYVTGIQLGDEGTAGNAILGDAGTINARGKALVSVRAGGVRRNGPRLGGVTVLTDSSVAGSAFDADREVAASIAVDGAVGAVRGIRVGATRIGSIDLLGSATLTPNANRGSLRVGGTPATLGFGVRLGLLSETRRLPAVSFSSVFRGPRHFAVTMPALPTDSGESVRLELRGGSVSVLGLRLASSKRVGRFGVTAGIGQDTYYTTSEAVVIGSGTLENGSDDASFDVTRRNVFAGLSYAAGHVTFSAELGRLSGGHVGMANTFGPSPTVARNYLTFGIRIPAGRTLDRD